MRCTVFARHSKIAFTKNRRPHSLCVLEACLRTLFFGDSSMPHPLISTLYPQMVLPVMSAPMFIVSGPELVVAQCASGIIGAMPALNARPQSELTKWLTQIETELAALRQREPNRVIAPYAINHIIHASNERLEQDMEVCAAHKVPLIITSLRAPNEI